MGFCDLEAIMKILNGSIILAATFMLLAVTSTCIAEGLIAESMREKERKGVRF
jgi:hypothetical protein